MDKLTNRSIENSPEKNISGPDLLALESIFSDDRSNTLLYKQAIVTGREQIHAAFENGATISQILGWQTELTDLIFKRLWEAL